MSTDLSVILAILAHQPVEEYGLFLRSQVNYLLDRQHNSLPHLSRRLNTIFVFLYSWLNHIAIQHRHLPETHAYSEWLKQKISGSLAREKYYLQQWYQHAQAEGLTGSDFERPDFPLLFDLLPVSQLEAQTWQQEWDYTPDPDTDFAPAITGNNALEKFRNLAAHNLFTGISDTLLKQGISIKSRAAAGLEESVEDYPQHTPHYALYLAFLRLLQHGKNELNRFTKNHLDFYYRQVLQMTLRAAQGDKVHLLAELQKNEHVAKIAAGTLFKAGKDAAGNEIRYRAVRDTVINRAQIVSLRSLMASEEGTGAARHRKLYAATVANSADGRGKEIKTEDKSWSAFGLPAAENITETGFALASHLFYMQDGQRQVELICRTSTAIPAIPHLFLKKPKVFLTGQSKWEEAAVTAFSRRSAHEFMLKISISPDAEPIVPYEPNIHEGAYDTRFPVMRLTWNAGDRNTLQDWSRISISRINIGITVNGFKKIVAYNDMGPVDTAKPFMPFGANPHAGSAFIVGSREIFMKDNCRVNIYTEWDNLPQPEGIISHMSVYVDGMPLNKPLLAVMHNPSFNYKNLAAQASISPLAGGAWGYATAAQNLFAANQFFGSSVASHIRVCAYKDELRSRGLFDNYPEAEIAAANQEATLAFTVEHEAPVEFGTEPVYDLNTRRGFIKIELKNDLGHKDFIQRFTTLATQQKTPPPQPYTPLAKSISLDYSVSATLLTNTTVKSPDAPQFFSIHPFGQKEEHLALNNESVFRVVPAYPEDGNFYIGLDAVPQDAAVSVLVQVSEGSGDPLVRRQPVEWKYLAVNNQWKNFEDGKIQDATDGFLRSGIVSFAVPGDISRMATIMGGKHCWIKASVARHPAAVARLLGVHAQALLAEFAGNADSYSQQLAPSTISKLVIAHAAIKKLEQPYAGFGGRPIEEDAFFYRRVSERLRHKARAITIWDYEHMVLEAFPQIYKVKCLNHTRTLFDESGNEKGDNEGAPGYVVVVPVPKIQHLATRNPLRPLTDLDTLDQIERFLKTSVSAQVRLQVRNPVFEEIVIKCHIRFHGDEPAFYQQQLLKELKAFLSPWAYQHDGDIEFGGSISKSTLIHFIEKRSYVDYLTRFRLYLRKEGIIQPNDLEEIKASGSRTVLVMAPSRFHQIQYTGIQC